MPDFSADRPAARTRASWMRTALACAVLAAALIAGRSHAIPGTSYSLPIVNLTGLEPSETNIWVLGFSSTSQVQLSFAGSTGSFSAIPAGSGTITATLLPTSSPTITLPASTALTGARVYLFVGDSSSTAPSVAYTGGGASITQPANPPTSTVPPYGFIEITVPSGGGLPTIDVQTVDGFTVPISITVDNGTTVGQPLGSAGAPVCRATVFAAYNAFMTSLGSLGAPYLPLLYTDNGGGILNPYAFLSATDSNNSLENLGSPLNTLFDSTVNQLFSNSKLSIQGIPYGTIPAQAYKVVSTSAITYPGATLAQPALQLKGADGTRFAVFSPVGLTVPGVPNGSGFQPILGTIVRNRIAFETPVPAGLLAVGMFVNGAGIGATPPAITKLITVPVRGKPAVRAVELNQVIPGAPAPRSPYSFSKVPTIFASSGTQVFGNMGVFADSTARETDGNRQQVLANLENQIVSAINRGVANLAPAPKKGVPGYTTAYWATETNWYPRTTVQNLFALFMHIGVVETGSTKTPIFVQTAPTKNARGQWMGQAYGFAYDENPGPYVPGSGMPTTQPEVPAKFDPVPAGTTTMTVTLGAWMPASDISVVNGCLLVVGSSSSDRIVVQRAPHGMMKVFINNVSQGTFGPVTCDVIVYGLGGDDHIDVDGRIPNRVKVDGGAGRDTIDGIQEAEEEE